jgi:hypothetical protein
VTPAISSTIAILLPIIRLKRLDLPTLGLPTTETTGIDDKKILPWNVIKKRYLNFKLLSTL